MPYQVGARVYTKGIYAVDLRGKFIPQGTAGRIIGIYGHLIEIAVGTSTHLATFGSIKRYWRFRRKPGDQAITWHERLMNEE